MKRKPSADVVRQFISLREIGLSHKYHGLTDSIYKRLYSVVDDKIIPNERYFIYSDYSGSTGKSCVGPTGAIFNLAFNADGSILGAATERKSVLLFDPVTRKLIDSVENAHSDSVNCIRFLDTRLFATCSDDTTVALWDARYLKNRLRTLTGHSNWVKNIEFSYRENCLVTSGFDGAIFTWDINRYSEREGLECKKAFYNNGLMRMKLTPDGTKMVVSTTNAYIMIIHDLCLDTLAQDLHNFKPNLYRLMQISGEPMSNAFRFTHLFHAKRNRVEFISDFPSSNDAEVISSLQLHPQGWVAVSRNISSDERSEWCCVHDIQSYPPSTDDDVTFNGSPELENVTVRPRPSVASTSSSLSASTSASLSGLARLAAFMQVPSSPNESSSLNEVDPASASTASANVSTEEDAARALSAQNRAVMVQFFQGQNRIRERWETTDTQQRSRDNDSPDSDSSEGDNSVPGILLFTDGSDPRNPISGFMIHIGGRRRNSPRARQEIPKDARLHKNRQRLTHYIEESNHGRGYIKEISFSPDGRVLASPFAHGIRLLSFDEQVRDLSDNPPSGSPKVLHELSLLTKIHNDVVLSTIFAPSHQTLVSGCMGGKIVWHEPTI